MPLLPENGHMNKLGSADSILLDGFRLDRRAGCLFRLDQQGLAAPVVLGSRAFNLLSLLVERQGELVSKDDIMKAVWPGRVVEEANLNVQISRLRHLLDRDRGQGSCIQTISGRGYSFVGAVRQAETDAPPVSPIAAASKAPRLSIVVLPFANLSADPDQEYFADAITDDLTTDLSRISGSFVIARTTAFTYKGKSVGTKQIGRDLGVRYALEGSVRRVGDKVRVNVQLIDTETGAHIWAERLETDPSNLAKAQDEITGRLARTLNVELVEAAGRRIEQERTVDPDVRDMTMRGWASFNRPYSMANRQEALRNFERALNLDPRSVDARIGIALVLVSNIADVWANSPRADEARAEQLLLEAVERDAHRSMARLAIGMLRRMQNRLAVSRVELETAIALDRNNARAFRQLGQTIMFLGQPEAAIPYIEKAVQLNPRDPNIAIEFRALGLCRLFLGQVDDAIELLTRARAANPRMWSMHLYLAGALGFKGELDEARAALADALRLKPEINSLAGLPTFCPWITNPQHWALLEKTANVGLRRAGLAEQ
jgi:adenylate cyclase